MPNTTTAFDYDRDVSEAHLAASGWDIGAFHHSNPFECHAIYVCDYRSGRVDLFSATFSDVEKTHVASSPDNLSGMVARLMQRHQRNRLSKRGIRAFLPVLLGYIKTTRTYAQWRQQADQNERMHFVLNIYPHGRTGTVRPFVLRETRTVVDVSTLIGSSEAVRKADHANHPEWFDSAQPAATLTGGAK